MIAAAANGDALHSMIQVVEEFRKYDPKMELGQLLIYLLVAAKPGIKTGDLIPATGLTSSAISRNVLALSSHSYRTDDSGKPLPGHDLLTQVTDPFDSRAKLVAPTRRGQMLAAKIAGILSRCTAYSMKGSLADGT